MPIKLSDIPNAVADYMNAKVTTVVSRVTADSGSLNPEEEGTFTVTVTNAAAPDGVRLTNVVHHLRISPAGTALLKVPGSAAILTREGLSQTSQQIPRNTFVDAMYVTHFFGILEVGETLEVTFEVLGVDEGNATITCDIHADIDQASLFPLGENSPGIERSIRVE